MSWSRAALILPLALTACGFSVRGAPDLPPGMSAVYVDSPDRYSEFYRALVERIRASKLTLADDPLRADTVIRVSRDQTGRRTLSVSARNVPTEYEVHYTVEYSVFIDGKEVLAPTQLILARDYIYDETLVLGKALEEETLKRAIAEDLVGMVVQHIAAIR